MHRESRDHPRDLKHQVHILLLGDYWDGNTWIFSNEEWDKRFEDENRRFPSAQPLVISKLKRPSGALQHTLDAVVANLTPHVPR